MTKKFHIRRSSKLCHVVCTMVPLSKSVRNRCIGLVKHLFYLIDENSIAMVSLNETINKVDAKFCITQIFSHDQPVIDSRKLI